MTHKIFLPLKEVRSICQAYMAGYFNVKVADVKTPRFMYENEEVGFDHEDGFEFHVPVNNAAADKAATSRATKSLLERKIDLTL